jgi:hypothetical protein
MLLDMTGRQQEAPRLLQAHEQAKARTLSSCDAMHPCLAPKMHPWHQTVG